MDRRRTKHTESLGDRLAQEAGEARTRAETMPPGPERDALLRKARQVDTAMHPHCLAIIARPAAAEMSPTPSASRA
jgi:hypothetical protein